MTHKKQNAMMGGVMGALLGGLAGGVTMLLIAPQSGEDIRTKMKGRSIQLLDNALSRIENAVSRMRAELHPQSPHVTRQRRARVVHHTAHPAVQTNNQESVSLASPNEEGQLDKVDNLVEQQPIAENVVNDSLGG